MEVLVYWTSASYNIFLEPSTKGVHTLWYYTFGGARQCIALDVRERYLCIWNSDLEYKCAKYEHFFFAAKATRDWLVGG